MVADLLVVIESLKLLGSGEGDGDTCVGCVCSGGRGWRIGGGLKRGYD